MNPSPWAYVCFSLFILAILALDLRLFHRNSRAIGIKEAFAWTAVWVALALSFNAGLWYFVGRQKALEFLTGYLLEKSLSLDNLLVFALIFSYFGLPPKHQHAVLFWGILGALIMRGAMIGLGVALVSRFGWVLYAAGAFLLVAGSRMVFKKKLEMHPEKNLLVRGLRKLIPVSQHYQGGQFFTRETGSVRITPLMIVLVCIEVTDLMFATDSISAVFGVTQDPFIIYTSNVFAILGLRSLYFALSGMIARFRYLKFGVAFVLGFIGVKMLAHSLYEIDTAVTLIVVMLALVVSVVASLPSHKPSERVPDIQGTRRTTLTGE